MPKHLAKLAHNRVIHSGWILVWQISSKFCKFNCKLNASCWMSSDFSVRDEHWMSDSQHKRNATQKWLFDDTGTAGPTTHAVSKWHYRLDAIVNISLLHMYTFHSDCAREYSYVHYDNIAQRWGFESWATTIFHIYHSSIHHRRANPFIKSNETGLG